MSVENHLVIMAGGVGSRFWPMSTPECPKQFIDVLGCGRTLIQLTADRFKGICPPENIWVVTSKKYADIVKQQLPELPESNILQATSECQYRCDSFGPYRYECRRVSACDKVLS